MTTCLSITFPWGRYHANPWARANNEGAVEWPPSPWRLLRAIYSAWKVHAPELKPERVEPLLEKLCSSPTFLLPPHTEAHTRHYLPGTAHKEDVKTDTDKTLDSFVVMARGGSVGVEWEVDLDEEERETLRQLCAGVRYLGRAESIVDVALVEDLPIGSSFRSEPGAKEGSFVLAATGPESVATLVQTPADVRKSRRLVPEYTQTIVYPVKEVVQPAPPRTKAKPREANAVRFMLTGSVHPSRYESLAVGDLMHRALTKKADNGEHSTTLTGRSSDGKPLTEGHQHAHYFALPGLAEFAGRRIDSIIAWAPAGFTEHELDVMARLRRLSSNRLRGIVRVELTLVDVGRIEDVAPDLVGAASAWTSVTPYSPVLRHHGSLGEQLEADVRREAEHRGLPAVASARMIEGPWLQYRRYRPGREKLQRSRPAYGLTLEFAEPVPLDQPLALGQLSHYGLGLFRPVQNPN